MDAIELMNKLMRHPVVLGQLPLQMQLGLPYLDKKRSELCIRFAPHREIFNNHQLEIYPRQYILEFVYPFEKVICFRNLLYEREINLSVPLCILKTDFLAVRGKYNIYELYSECSRILTLREKMGSVSDVMIANYQKKYFDILGRLGLVEVYGGLD